METESPGDTVGAIHNENSADQDIADSSSENEEAQVAFMPVQTPIDRDFIEWFLKNGGWMSEKITLGNFEGYGKGLFVKEPIEKGETVLHIPDKIVMNPTVAKDELQRVLNLAGVASGQTPVDLDQVLVTEMQSQYTFTPRNIIKAIHLQWEMSLGEDSFFHPYIQTLPHFVGLATNFTPAELQLFQQPKILQTGNFVRFGQEKLWKELLVPVVQALRSQSKDPSVWTYSKFDLCRQLVASHSIVVTGGDSLVVPMAEKINHSPLLVNKMVDLDVYTGVFDPLHHLRTKRDDGSSIITIKADRDFPPGQQFMEDYGNGPNLHHVMYTGFVPDVNFGHYVTVPLPPLPQSVEPIRQALAVPSLEHAEVRSTNMVLDSTVWRYLDLALMTPNQIEMALAALSLNSYDLVCEPLQVACGEIWKRDSRMYKAIQEGAEAALASFPTSLEEDAALLEDWSRQPKYSVVEGIQREHAMLAIRYRMKEKEFLARIVNEVVVVEQLQDPKSSNNMMFIAFVVLIVSIWYTRRN